MLEDDLMGSRKKSERCSRGIVCVAYMKSNLINRNKDRRANLPFCVSWFGFLSSFSFFLGFPSFLPFFLS